MLGFFGKKNNTKVGVEIIGTLYGKLRDTFY